MRQEPKVVPGNNTDDFWPGKEQKRSVPAVSIVAAALVLGLILGGGAYLLGRFTASNPRAQDPASSSSPSPVAPTDLRSSAEGLLDQALYYLSFGNEGTAGLAVMSWERETNCTAQMWNRAVWKGQRAEIVEARHRLVASEIEPKIPGTFQFYVHGTVPLNPQIASDYEKVYGVSAVLAVGC